MTTTNKRQVTWVLVSLTVIICLCCCVNEARAGEDIVGEARTVLRGLQNWHSAFPSLEGSCSVQYYYSKRETEWRLAHDQASGVAVPASYGNCELQVIRFSIDGEAFWRCDMMQIVPSGMFDPWPTFAPTPMSAGEVDTAAVEQPVLYSRSDGINVFTLPRPSRRLSIEPYDLAMRGSSPIGTVREHLLMEINGTLFLGEWLAARLGEVDTGEAQRVVDVDIDASLNGEPCHRLSLRYEFEGLNAVDVWIAPRLGYMPMRYEALLFVEPDTLDSGMRYTSEVVAAKEVIPGYFLPCALEKHLYVYDGTSEDNWRKSWRVAFREIDADPTTSLHDFAIPLGTVVQAAEGSSEAGHQVGQTALALREFSNSVPPEIEPVFNAPLIRRDLASMFHTR